jgi:hypothetical protein
MEHALPELLLQVGRHPTEQVWATPQPLSKQRMHHAAA